MKEENLHPFPSLGLQANAAVDLMTPNPVSIRDSAGIDEAIRLLTDRGFSAAPVIDGAGRPVGVLSGSDLLVHVRERASYSESSHPYYNKPELALNPEETSTPPAPSAADPATVRDLMTPVVFSVAPDSPVERVVTDMVDLKVHRLFVVDRDGVLVGVISALDVLKRLERIGS